MRQWGKRVQDAAVVALFICIISVSVVTLGAKKVHIDLPEWLELDNNQSWLEGKQYTSFPNFSATSFSSSSFQNDVEQFISDRYPCRDSILMGNAAWQRALIGSSADLFGYSVYPTFYGSAYSYDLQHDQVVQTLVAPTDATEDEYESAASAYNAFTWRNSSRRMFFYRVDRMSTSSNNPTHALVSSSVDTEYLAEHFFNLLDSSIQVIDGTFPSEDSLASAFFHTDHHWNGVTAYDAYKSILKAMNDGASLEDASLSSVTYSKVPFYGSTSRSGLCLTSKADYIEDIPLDLTGITVSVNGVAQDSKILQQTAVYQSGDVDKNTFTNHYAKYFHTDYALVDIQSDHAQTDKTLLIVGDSYSNCIERYFTSYYGRVISYDARYNDASIQDVADEYSADDILVLMGSTNFKGDNIVAKLDN